MKEFDNIEFPADFDDLSKYAPTLQKLQGKGEGVPAEIRMQAGFVLPENYFGENSELLTSLVNLPDGGTFIVPENYFDDLASKIISLAELNALKDNEGFTLPENYFETFSDDIVANANIHALKNDSGFEVPVNYFGRFDEELNTRLALDNLKQDEGFDVPENYFDKFSDRLITKVALEDSIKDQEVVPEGYFDTLADRIQARIEEEGRETSIALSAGTSDVRRENTGRGRVIVFAEVFKRYARPAAIAASAALLIGVAYWFMNREDDAVKKQFAGNDTTHVKHITPVPAPEQKDSIVVPVQPEKKNIAQKPGSKKPKDKVNLPKDENVLLAKNDVMEQSDLIDMNAVTEFLSENEGIVLEDQEQHTDPNLKEIFLNTADPGDYIDGINN